MNSVNDMDTMRELENGDHTLPLVFATLLLLLHFGVMFTTVWVIITYIQYVHYFPQHSCRVHSFSCLRHIPYTSPV